MKNILETIGAFAIIIIALYFFVYRPDVKSAYNEGLEKCKSDVDSVLIPGDPYPVVHDSIIYVEKEVPAEKDSTGIKAKFDSTLVSQKDTIGVHAVVRLRDTTAIWQMEIRHKNTETVRVDTFKVYEPKYVTETVKEISWLFVLLGYVAGILSAITIWLFSP